MKSPKPLAVVLFSGWTVLGLAGAAGAGTTSFFDTTFNVSDWTAGPGPTESPVLIEDTGGSPVISVAQQTLSGGNNVLDIGLSLSSGGGAELVMVNNQSSCSPSSTGAITGISYSIKETYPSGTADLPWRPLVVQDGKYFAPSPSNRHYPGGAGTFETFSAAGLGSSDFGEVKADGNISTVDMTSHPDFWQDAPDIHLGIQMYGNASGSANWHTYFDDYSITIDHLPVVEGKAVGGMAFGDIESSPGAIAVNFDEYVSNPQPGAGPVNGDVKSFPNTFTGFVSPDEDNTTFSDPLPRSVGLVVDSTDGTVTFHDGASGGLPMSDIRAGGTGHESLKFTFVDPAGSDLGAVVSRVGFRIGSVVDNDVVVKFFDPWGNELALLRPDLGLLPGTPSTQNYQGTVGFVATVDGREASIIHSFELTSTTDDIWLVGDFDREGSFGGPLVANDLVFSGFTVIPEPSSLVLWALGATMLFWGRRWKK